MFNTAAYVTALGCDALMTHKTGVNMVAVGTKAMLMDKTGTASVAVGTSSAYNALSLNGSVFIRDSYGFAGTYNKDDGLSVFIGSRTAYSLFGGLANLLIGETAGDTPVRFSYCTFVGRSSGRSTPDETFHSTAIGHNADVTDSQQIQLGTAIDTVHAFGSVQSARAPRTWPICNPLILLRLRRWFWFWRPHRSPTAPTHPNVTPSPRSQPVCTKRAHAKTLFPVSAWRLMLR